MNTYIFDIEGNGYGEIVIDRKGQVHTECDQIHLLVLRSYPQNEVQVFRRNGTEDTIAEGWDILRSADVLIGHNIIQYDLPVLSRIIGTGDWRSEVGSARVFDTLVAARLIYPDAKFHPFGGNSLAAFGAHLKCAKGDFKGPWDVWTQEMEDYCVRDTLVNQKIFEYLMPKVTKFPTALKLEHRVAEICSRMQDNGVTINLTMAEALIDQLDLERALANDALIQSFPPLVETMKTPEYYYAPNEVSAPEYKRIKYKRKKDAPRGIGRLVAGPLKTKKHPFNPGSAMQVADRLKEKYGWVAPRTDPTPSAPEGNPSVTEEVLKGLPYPEAKLMLRANMAEKRLQHLRDWTTRARASRTPGRIHPQINPCGCNTSRASHQQPNQTACPKVLDPKLRGYEGRYGWEMRSCWGPREGWVQVGGDASGLELRELGHSLALYDGGAYAREVVTGDIHTLNQKAGGLHTRDQAKTISYAYLYGAGDEHIGELIAEHQSLSAELIEANRAECEAWVKKQRGRDRSKWLKLQGRKFRDSFERKLPALAQLTTWCKQCASERGFIPLIDGRHAPVRSEHAALNVLLQGNGALFMKLAMVILDNKIEANGWRDLCGWMLWPHDEFQFEAHPSIAEELGQAIVESMEEAGRRLKLQCPMTGEYTVGANWAETH